MIVISANRNSVTPPTVPAGWVAHSVSAGTTTTVFGWKIATSSSETSGTWTNALSLHVAVYRGDAGILSISSAMSVASGTAANVPYNALANGLVYRSGVLDNWYIGAAIQLNSTNSLETAPSGMTNVSVESSAGVFKSVYHDTNASQLSNWASATTTGVTSAAWGSRVIQLFEFDGPAFGGGGGGIFFRPGMSGGMSE
jgi:hypothetical protein